MDMLAKALSTQLSAPVENGTKITGSFDFTLRWQPDRAPIGDVTRPCCLRRFANSLDFDSMCIARSLT